MLIRAVFLSFLIVPGVSASCLQPFSGRPYLVTLQVFDRELVVSVVPSLEFDTLPNQQGYRPKIVLLGDVSQIRDIHRDYVSSLLPKSNCQNRWHDNGDYTIAVRNDGSLHGSSTFRYQHWKCIDLPRLRTKIFTHTVHPNFTATPIVQQDRPGHYRLLMRFRTWAVGDFSHESTTQDIVLVDDEIDVPESYKSVLNEVDVRFKANGNALVLEGTMLAGLTDIGAFDENKACLLKDIIVKGGGLD